MTKRLLALLVLSCLALPATAATHYIWCGASGAATGADWTNALTDIPDPLVRGDTYVIAGSAACTYPPHTFNDVSGTTLITVRKAEASLDSGAAGWQASFATDPAAWKGAWTDPHVGSGKMWSVCLNYVTFDGITGDASPTTGPSGFGFQVLGNGRAYGVITLGCGSDTLETDVTFNHIDAGGYGLMPYYPQAVSSCSCVGTTVTIGTAGDIGGDGTTDNVEVWDSSDHDVLGGTSGAKVATSITPTQVVVSGVTYNPCVTNTYGGPAAYVALDDSFGYSIYAHNTTEVFQNLTIENSYLHDNTSPVRLFNVNNAVVQGNYFARNRFTPAQHSSSLQYDESTATTTAGPASILRNFFLDNAGTGWITLMGQASNPYGGILNGVSVSGNIFTCHQPISRYMCQGSQIVGDNGGSSVATDVIFAGNTIASTGTYGNVGMVLKCDGSTTRCSSAGGGQSSGTSLNNLFWNIGPYVRTYAINPATGYSAFQTDETLLNSAPLDSAWTCSTASNDVCLASGQSDPFVNDANYDFRLAGDAVSARNSGLPTAAGMSGLASPYSTDFGGATRGADGTWERGAYEYSDPRYVTPSGAGAKDGSDWNNAYAGLPASFSCGVTYYLAGGNYDYSSAGTTISNTCTAGSPITIYKAVSGGPGNPQNVAGWVPSYGTSQAVLFQSANADQTAHSPEFFYFPSGASYITIDGVTPTSGTPAASGSYGIVLRSPNTPFGAWIDVNGPHITIKHIEEDGSRPDYYGVDITSCSSDGTKETVNLASSITGVWVNGNKVDVYADSLSSSSSPLSPRNVPITIVSGTQITVPNTNTGTCSLSSKSYVALDFSSSAAIQYHSPSANDVFSDNYVHDVTSDVLASSCDTCTIQRNYFSRTHSIPTQHQNVVSGGGLNNSIVAQNIMEDITGTAEVTPTCGGSCSWTNDAIYSNLMFCSQAADSNASSSTASPQCGTMEITDDEGANPVTNSLVYGNTLVWRGSASMALGKIHFTNAASTGNTIENNFLYCPNTSAMTLYTTTGTVDYNTTYSATNNNLTPETGHNHYYCPSSGGSLCSHKVTFVDPFAASSDSGKDFRFSSESVDPGLNDGLALPAPYNIDLAGVTRGADGTWERGAYDYDDGPVSPSGTGSIGSGSSASTGSGSFASCGNDAHSSCARKDLALQALGGLPFTVGSISNGQGYQNFPYNTIFRDPDFGSLIVRATDFNTIPVGYSQPTGNCDLTTADSPASDTLWSSDDNWFFFKDCWTNKWLAKFDPTTMQVTYAPWTATTGHYLPMVEIGFGRAAADAGQLIGTGSNPVSLANYIIRRVAASDYSNASPVFTTVRDLSTCPGLSFFSNANFNFKKTMGWLNDPRISSDDKTYVWFGGPHQEQGWLVARVYNPDGLFTDNTGQTCDWVDLRTGVTGGDTWTTPITAGIPLHWDSNGGPGTAGGPGDPTFAGATTTGGALVSGHTYDLAPTLAEQCFVQASSCYLNTDGVGESDTLPIQRVTLTGGQNSITTAVAIPGYPYPGNLYNNANYPDTSSYTHVNWYAQDEANCGNAQCPLSSLVLQPAGNFQVAGGTPVSPGTCTVGTQLTASNYTCTWVMPNYTLWAVGTSSGIADKSISIGAVTGALRYQVIRGPWTKGTATCDPINDGSACYNSYGPVVIRDAAGAGSVTDDGSESLGNLAATGTITGGASATLLSLTSSGTPPPTYSTIGLGLHQLHVSNDGQWIVMGMQFPPFQTNWKFGTNNLVNINLYETGETSPDNTYYAAPSNYTTSNGHSSTLGGGWLYNGGGPNVYDFNFDINYRPMTSSSTIRSLVPAKPNGYCNLITGFPSPNSACQMIWKFPALDPSGADNWDMHQSTEALQEEGKDLFRPVAFSSTAAGVNSYQCPLCPTRAWGGEIVQVNPWNGTVSRLAHIRASGTAYYIANCSVGNHCESQYDHDGFSVESNDGKYILFDSDMGWMLGCDPSTNQSSPPNYGCTFNANGQAASGRSLVSVFILKAP